MTSRRGGLQRAQVRAAEASRISSSDVMPCRRDKFSHLRKDPLERVNDFKFALDLDGDTRSRRFPKLMAAEKSAPVVSAVRASAPIGAESLTSLRLASQHGDQGGHPPRVEHGGATRVVRLRSS